jgi:DNA mismatch repair protein PMS2
MIGDFLKLSDMKRIINNLSNLVSPWNCPHGRPTIRKINNIKQEINA